MSQVTTNGHTYSDDGSAALDMRNGGHRTNLIPMLGDVITDVGAVSAAVIAASGSASAASGSATSAQNYAAALTSTSTTSLLIAVASKTFTTQAGKQYAAGQWVTATSNANSNNWMFGQVTSYSGTTLIVNVTAIGGAGTLADWNISIAGVRGPAMIGGAPLPRSARTSNTAIGYADMGSLIDITSGTFTQTFVAVATLGANWWCYVRNSGTGDITLDPNASETIDGLTSFAMYPGEVRLIQCDGSVLRSVVVERGTGGYLCAREEQASGTAGGAAALTTWETRTLNTVVKNNIGGASLAANAITLTSGSYYISARYPTGGSSTMVHKGALYNNTDASFALLGSATVYSFGLVSGVVSITATKSFSLKQYSSATSATGMGAAISSGQPEVYAQVEIWRIA